MAGGLKRWVWLFFAAAICLAVLKSVPHDTSDLVDWGRDKAGESESVFDGVMNEVKKRGKNFPKPEKILPESPADLDKQVKKAEAKKKAKAKKAAAEKKAAAAKKAAAEKK